MPSHTKEPWIFIRNPHHTGKPMWRIYTTDSVAQGEEHYFVATLSKANAARIVACVNGCAGLNPDAYRTVVEALQAMEGYTHQTFDSLEAGQIRGKEIQIMIQHALAQAEDKNAQAL